MIFFFNEQAQTVLISINKEGYTDEKPRKVPLKETKIQEQKTVQRAAQASHYPPTKLASCLAPAIPHALASSLIFPTSDKVEASRRSKVLAFLSFQISQFTSSKSDLIAFI